MQKGNALVVLEIIAVIVVVAVVSITAIVFATKKWVYLEDWPVPSEAEAEDLVSLAHSPGPPQVMVQEPASEVEPDTPPIPRTAPPPVQTAEVVVEVEVPERKIRRTSTPRPPRKQPTPRSKGHIPAPRNNGRNR